MAAVLAECLMRATPVTVDLGGRVLGIVGDRVAALELGRGLLCSAAVLHGPSDLAVAVVTDRPADWDWAKWLPHVLVAPTDRRRLLAGDPVETGAVLDWIATGPGAGRRRPVLVVVNRGALTDPSGLAVRRVLGSATGDVAGIVLADGEDDLPTECTDLVDCGQCRARLCTDEGSIELAPAGVVPPVAVTLARGLARYRDPDQVDAGSGLPRAVRLLETAGMAGPSPEELIRRWSNGGVGLDAMLGVTAAGPMRIDLATAGPHALVAGTTGSGKSELLRTLVASLALAHDPEHVNFVLVDYKGGSAFDAAERLPHTVGLVTDLDAGLADRALRCLEAELRHRERELRTLGAPDIERFRRLGGRLPRMLIVVDELAALARELPGSSVPWSTSQPGGEVSASTSCWPPSGRPGWWAMPSEPTPTSASLSGSPTAPTPPTCWATRLQPPSGATCPAGGSSGWAPATWFLSRRRRFPPARPPPAR